VRSLLVRDLHSRLRLPPRTIGPGFRLHLARRVHEFYFNPKYEEFKERTLWSLSNAFTSAFKELEPIPQFKVTAKFEWPWINVIRRSLEDPNTRRGAKKCWMPHLLPQSLNAPEFEEFQRGRALHGAAGAVSDVT